jgi:hypothetical protein
MIFTLVGYATKFCVSSVNIPLAYQLFLLSKIQMGIKPNGNEITRAKIPIIAVRPCYGKRAKYPRFSLNDRFLIKRSFLLSKHRYQEKHILHSFIGALYHGA